FGRYARPSRNDWTPTMVTRVSARRNVELSTGFGAGAWKKAAIPVQAIAIASATPRRPRTMGDEIRDGIRPAGFPAIAASIVAMRGVGADSVDMARWAKPSRRPLRNNAPSR